jgi:L-asparaginase
MRQANWAGADGPANLLNSVKLAASPETRGRGALLLMNDEVFLAREVTKSNTTRLNAFSAPEAGPAGVTDPDGIFFRSPPPSDCPKPLIDIDKVESFPKVDIIYSYIGADSTMIDAMVAAGARGLVVAGVGRGGTTPSQQRALNRAVDKGVIVVTSNRTGGGRVGRPTNPDSLRDIPEGRGARMGAGDLNPQKARMLLMLALATGQKPAAIATLIASAQ